MTNEKLAKAVRSLQGAATSCGDPKVLNRWSDLYLASVEGRASYADVRNLTSLLAQTPRENHLDRTLPAEANRLVLPEPPERPRQSHQDARRRARRSATVLPPLGHWHALARDASATITSSCSVSLRLSEKEEPMNAQIEYNAVFVCAPIYESTDFRV